MAGRVPEWTSEQIVTVRRMIREGVGLDAIALKLGEPYTARLVEGRARRLGIPLPTRRAHQGTTKLAIRSGDRIGTAADPA